MTSAELDNLVRIGKLKREPPSERELAGLLASAMAGLQDAGFVNSRCQIRDQRRRIINA